MNKDIKIQQKYLPTIGLEIHAELNTKSKLFCGCKNPASHDSSQGVSGGDPFCSSSEIGVNSPNIHTCPVCLGLPGALPVMNKQAVIDTINIGKALGGTIAPITKWDRKHYFYPDLPKGYQISQFDVPIVTGGQLEITNNKSPHFAKAPRGRQIQNSKIEADDQEPRTKIRITRIHLEEDTGKLIHDKDGSSLVDLNRAGVPLVELVTEPDIHDGKTAADFAREYQLILRTLGVADAEMERGHMRIEVNISLSPNSKLKTQNSKLGTKVEIKNLNSFKSVEKAIEYEIKRQTELLEKKESIVQETRGWDDGRGTTISQRAKETSADYRYFPEPDLPPIDTTKLEIGETTPLPDASRNELLQAGVDSKSVEIIIHQPELLSRLAELRITNYELRKNHPELNYIAEVAKLLIHYPKSRDKSAEELIKLAQMNPHQRKLALSGETHDQLHGEDEIKSIIETVLKKEIQAVADYKAGKQTVYGFLVGQVMRECKGQADPEVVNRLLKNMI
ncbi:hypothetical protein AUK41_02210 [Candidatus Berkelbacteria bacterium CG2_30_43_20]|uniref:Aspartyl/glutamyl-tRNA(Asn/Gln) amidotransferase subunit B n=1 Tax=Candidatus Berkelbacteria bacterium CG10_big_fil_rev_8_21_14_0_10_43_14 TaxID=1974515 RepID=A0A2M6R8T0_9BACT|nr:MAG: hypothetical protein AUK41_02210 [Candidatus Berkelbacteria bacterium CG2_30_43_20]PIS06962.1 MAG: Asp-tRNA(Asn)/Glu-tRNA(Gln) amidotransferase subunit GatB [Candidatus Berkelbacteria bacterium CG10_big_fil_rev_8_21_14_0_10_43_14]